MSFKLHPTPTENVNAGKRVLNKAVSEVLARTSGKGVVEDLVAAGVEMAAPDHEVGKTTPTQGQTHSLERPAFPDAVPWPPTQAPDHKPFKLKG